MRSNALICSDIAVDGHVGRIPHKMLL